MLFVVFSENVLNFAQALVLSVTICLPMYVCTSKILVIIVLFISCAMLLFLHRMRQNSATIVGG